MTRSTSYFLMSLLLAIVALPRDARSEPCVGAIDLAGREGVLWISVLPERPPPTASRIQLDSDSGAHIELAWDPYDGRGLSRAAVLTPGRWQISFWSEPQRDSQEFSENYAWQSVQGERCEDWRPSGPGASADYLVSERLEKPGRARIAIRALTMPTLGLFRATNSDWTVDLTPGALTRSFNIPSVGDAPEQVTQVLVRFVTGRIQRKAMRLATARVNDVLCAKVGDELLLPRTCAAFKTSDLRTLSASARPLATALVADLIRKGTRTMADDDTAVVDGTVEVAIDAIAMLNSRSQLSTAEAQSRYLDAVRTLVEGASPTPGICAARLALSLASFCTSSEQCDASFLREAIMHPSAYFELPDACGAHWTPSRATTTQIESAVAEGRRVFEAARGVTSRARLAAVVRGSLALLELASCADSTSDRCRTAKALVTVGRHSVEGDLVAAATAGLALAGDRIPWSPRQRTLATLFLHFVSEASALPHDAPQGVQAAQQHVERALAAIVDDTAGRDGRDGDLIFGLGTGLRATMGYEFGDGYRGPVRVPLALTLDRLARRANRAPGEARGLHAELGFLDVGNYLRFSDRLETEDIGWSDIASFSLSAGYFWGDSDLPFYVGGTGGFTPGTGDVDGVWHAGVEAGVYVPILDFN